MMARESIVSVESGEFATKLGDVLQRGKKGASHRKYRTRSKANENLSVLFRQRRKARLM